MTKADVKTLAIGGGIGIGAFLLAYFFGRRLVSFPMIVPSAVKWEKVS